MFTSNCANKTAFPIIVLQECGSTNSYMKARWKDFKPWTCLRAVSQTNGRGRFERQWVAQRDKDLTFSLMIQLNAGESVHLASLTPLIGLSILEVCEEIGVEPLIKWPNDLLVQGRKLAGILVEVVSQGEQHCAVIGVGMNVNSSRKSDSNLSAISLLDIIGKHIDLDEIMCQVATVVKRNWKELCQNGFSIFQEKFNQSLAWRGETRLLIDGNKREYGILEGVSAQGALLFRNAQTGIVQELRSGELSFRE